MRMKKPHTVVIVFVTIALVLSLLAQDVYSQKFRFHYRAFYLRSTPQTFRLFLYHILVRSQF